MGQAVNKRQLEVLQWIADGSPAGKWHPQDSSYKTSAAALRFRGLVTTEGRGTTWRAALTDAGKYYLTHGVYPPEATKTNPARATSGKAPARPESPNLGLGGQAAETLESAKSLIKRLLREKTITEADPEESTRAKYRRVLHACRTHHLVPEGHELRFTGRDAGDIVIMLSTGTTSENSDWDRIRTTTRRITTNLDSLRKALETSSILDAVSEELRPRAVAILLELASQLRAHDLKLGANTKLKTPKLFVQWETRKRNLTLKEILKEVPHSPTDAEQRQLRRKPWLRIPETEQVPTGRLRLTVVRDGSQLTQGSRPGYSYYRQNADEWSDEKRKLLERRTQEIARAIKRGIVEDDDAREREEQRRAEAVEECKRKEAAERRAWEEIRKRAREKALLELREATFARAFENWQGAQELRAFADRLEQEIENSTAFRSRPILADWLEWARARADALDPITNLDRLDDSVFNAEPSADDLRPHMKGWDPTAPHKDYTASTRTPNTPSTHVPQPRPWHPGMVGKPSWWRHRG